MIRISFCLNPVHMLYWLFGWQPSVSLRFTQRLQQWLWTYSSSCMLSFNSVNHPLNHLILFTMWHTYDIAMVIDLLRCCKLMQKKKKEKIVQLLPKQERTHNQEMTQIHQVFIQQISYWTKTFKWNSISHLSGWKHSPATSVWSWVSTARVRKLSCFNSFWAFVCRQCINFLSLLTTTVFTLMTETCRWNNKNEFNPF